MVLVLHYLSNPPPISIPQSVAANANSTTTQAQPTSPRSPTQTSIEATHTPETPPIVIPLQSTATASSLPPPTPSASGTFPPYPFVECNQDNDTWSWRPLEPESVMEQLQSLESLFYFYVSRGSYEGNRIRVITIRNQRSTKTINPTYAVVATTTTTNSDGSGG
jgi:hypothetical protein